MTLLEQAKQEFDKELDTAHATIMRRWQAYVANNLKTEKEITPSTSMICWQVPLELAQQIYARTKDSWPEGSEITSPEEMHITIKYLGEVDEYIAKQVIDYLQRLSKAYAPFDVVLENIDVFAGVEDGTKDAVIIRIKSPLLHQIKQTIEHDIGHLREETHPKYQPHITLAYVPVGSKWAVVNPEGVITAHDLCFARGGKFTNIPLTGILKGGKGSGNFGHSGRPGKVGGSSSQAQDLRNVAQHALSNITSAGVINVPWREATTAERNAEDDVLIDMMGMESFTWEEVPKRETNVSMTSTFVASQSHIDSRSIRRILEKVAQDGNYPEDKRILLVKNGDTYRIADGHHHLYAGKLLGLSTIPSEVIDLDRNTSKETFKQLSISEDSKKFLMDVRMEIFFEESDKLAEQVYNGDITIGEWQESMKSLIKGGHLSTAVIAKGGWDNMGPRDFGRLGTPTREQYKFLRGFAQTLDERRDDITLNYIKNRARMYGEAIVAVGVQVEAGFWFEDNLPWIPKDMSTTCGIRCHCYWKLIAIEVRKQFAIVEATWTLGEADHCTARDGKDGCVDRAGHIEVLRVPIDVYETMPSKIGGY